MNRVSLSLSRRKYPRSLPRALALSYRLMTCSKLVDMSRSSFGRALSGRSNPAQRKKLSLIKYLNARFSKPNPALAWSSAGLFSARADCLSIREAAKSESIFVKPSAQ